MAANNFVFFVYIWIYKMSLWWIFIRWCRIFRKINFFMSAFTFLSIILITWMTRFRFSCAMLPLGLILSLIISWWRLIKDILSRFGMIWQSWWFIGIVWVFIIMNQSLFQDSIRCGRQFIIDLSKSIGLWLNMMWIKIIMMTII